MDTIRTWVWVWAWVARLMSLWKREEECSVVNTKLSLSSTTTAWVWVWDFSKRDGEYA